MRGSTILILICMLVGIVILSALGTWQVKRLIWKEALIEQVNGRISQDPVSLSELLSESLKKEDHEYLPVTVAGTFDHDGEVYFFTTNKQGAAGWNVHTPLQLETGRTIIVNRGFVPFELKSPDERLRGQIAGIQSVTGLLRFPLKEKPFGSLANFPEKREFYWRNVPEMSAVMTQDQEIEFLPVIIDAGKTENPGGWPRGDTTIVSFSNNHVQYAVTWYGLALTLLGVGGFFLYSRRQNKDG